MTLKAKFIWHVVQVRISANLFSSHQVQMSDEESSLASDSEYSRDIACSLVLQEIGQVLFTFVIQYQDDPLRMWRVLHARYSVTTTFWRATVHILLARMKYIVQLEHEYVAT